MYVLQAHLDKDVAVDLVVVLPTGAKNRLAPTSGGSQLAQSVWSVPDTLATVK